MLKRLMNVGLMVLTMVMGTLTAGCGQPVDSVNNFLNGQACGSAIVTDYNQFVSNCNFSMGCANCRNSAQSFLNKYPNINCTAGQSTQSSVNNNSVTISQAFVQQQVQSIGCTL